MRQFMVMAALACSVFFSHAASAQCNELHVAPFGVDSNLGTLASPLRTITQAMNNASSGDTIIVHPGVYQTGSGGEVFPIQMRDGVSIQGTNALNTVIFALRQNVLRFDGNTGDFAGTCIQGISITNAQSAILMEGDPVLATIANCYLFENGEGIRMNTEFQGVGVPVAMDDTDNNGYTEHQPILLNLTICNNGIGILDAGDPRLGAGPFQPQDPDLTVNGEARPCISNCVIFGNGASDLEGVDNGAIAASAFVTSDAFGFSVIRPTLAAPVTAVSLAGQTLDTLFLHPDRGDYRLTHTATHPLVDAGDLGAICTNGTNLTNFFFGCNASVFILENDGEGYGNFRFDGAQLDIGADEQAEHSIAGFSLFSTAFTSVFNTLEIRGSSVNTNTSTIFNFPFIGTLGYSSAFPGFGPTLRPNDTTVPTPFPPPGLGLPPGGNAWFDLFGAGAQPSFQFATSAGPCVFDPIYSLDITIPPQGINSQWLWQTLPAETCTGLTYGQLSNLQHFRLAAGVPPFVGTGGFYRGPGDIVPQPFGFQLGVPVEPCELVAPECCEGEVDCAAFTQIPDRCVVMSSGKVLLEGHRWTVGQLLQLCEDGCLRSAADENGNICICIKSTRAARRAYIYESPFLTSSSLLQFSVPILVCCDGMPLAPPAPIIGHLTTPEKECNTIQICISLNVDCLCAAAWTLAPYGQLYNLPLIQVDFELCEPCP